MVGPVKPIIIDEEVDWCKASSQSGLYLFKPSLMEKLKMQGEGSMLRVTSEFDFHSGEPCFFFEAPTKMDIC